MNYVAASEQFFPEVPGGSGRVAWELAKLMRDRGHRVALVAGARESRTRPLHDYEGITLSRYEFPRLPSWHPGRLAAHVEAVEAAVAQLGGHWDVAHAHTLAPGLGVFKALPNARRIATIHSPAVLEQRINWRHRGPVGWMKLLVGEPVLRRAEHELYAAAHSLSALSHYTIAEIRRIYGEGIATRIECIPWWSEEALDRHPDKISARRAVGWDERGLALFTLRRLVPRMGLDILLRAMAKLRNRPGWSLYIGGEGPERSLLERIAARCDIADRVRFLGRVQDEELGSMYEACDAFVLPTRALECFGLIALEALAHGRPVIGARVGAIPEMLEPMLSDWLFDAGDERALAGLLEAYLTGALEAPPPSVLRNHAATNYSQEGVAAAYARWIQGPQGPPC